MHTEDFIAMLTSLNTAEEHPLMLVNAPTGTGKSYIMIQALCQYAADHQDFHAFFVTDQRKNLNQDTFRSAWKERAEKRRGTFDQYVAVLRSLEDTAMLVVKDWQHRVVPEELVTPDFETAIQALKIQLKYYQMAAQQNTDTTAAWQGLNKADFRLRQALITQLANLADVTGAIDEAGQETIKAYIAHADQPACAWVNTIYPTIELERRQILIMTTAKFIRSYTPFFAKYSVPFQYSSVLGNAVVILDEFDSTKQQLLDKAIDDALKARVDLVSLFDSLYRGLQKVDNMPVRLRELITKQASFNNIQAQAKQLQQTYALDHLYKNRAVTQDSGYVLHTAYRNLISQGRAWHAHLDQQSNQVILNTEGADTLHFRRMLGAVARFIRGVTRFMVWRARQYQNLHNAALVDKANGMTIRDACFTIYDALGLSAQQIEVLMSLGLDLKAVRSKTDYLPSYHRFQERGLSLFSFTNDDTHDLRTDINASFFAVTPERYLLAVLNKAAILGLSATATLPTVLDNYDLDYLKEILGKRLQDGSVYFSAATKAALNLKQRYQQAKIKIMPEVMTSKSSLIDQLKARIKTPLDVQKQTQLAQQFEAQLNLIDEQQRSYIKNRYLTLFDSFVVFLLDSNLTSFLGLQSQLPAYDKPTMDRKFIEAVFSQLVDLLPQVDHPTPQLRFITTRGQTNVATQLAGALALPATENTRVYLLSAYQTIGVGQNLQHQLGTFERKRVVSVAPADAATNDPRHDRLDLAGIYLGDVTHILSSQRRFTMDVAGIRLITELLYLVDANEISIATLADHFGKLQKQVLRKQPEAAKSIVVSYSRMIIQALGRMNRAFNKLQTVKILATTDVLAKISRIGVDMTTVSPEYQALISYAHKLPRQFEATIAETRKHNWTQLTYHELQTMAAQLQTDAVYAARYQQWREFILAHPTVSNEQLQAHPGLQVTDALSQYLINDWGQPHYEVRAPVKDTGDFDFSKRGMTVSAAAAKLPTLCKIPGFKAYMAKRGYPVTWQMTDRIINPVQFINLYLGLLGEVAGQFLFEREWPSFKLQSFNELANHELFDFKATDGVAVDFKMWRGIRDVDPAAERQQVERKLKRLEHNTGYPWRVLIINVVGINHHQPVPTVDQRILEVPGLIDNQGNMMLTPAAKLQIGGFLVGRS